MPAKALAEVTQNLRDAMGAEDGDDSSGIFAIYEEVPAGHWANGGRFCLSANCSRRWAAMFQRRGNAR